MPATMTVKKPKKVVEQADIATLLQDPVLRDLAPQAIRPECAPVALTVQQAQAKERQRRYDEARIDSSTNGKNGTWAFVKNGNLKEEITFKNGDKFRFPSTVFVTKDEKLAERLLEVQEQFFICLK